jgi:hypothetical protein
MIEEELLESLDKIFRDKRNHKIIRAISHFFTDLKQGFHNIFIWLPIIWQDRQFDHGYFYTIMWHKLKLMEKFFGSDDPCAIGADKCAKDIKVARILCGRLMNGDYSNPFKWADWKYADRQEKQDREYLFDLMKKKVPAWWD